MNDLAASGNETDDAIRNGSERGRTFGGLEDAKTAARSRSREEHPPASGKCPRERESGSRDPGRLGLDRRHHLAVLLREKLEESAWRQAIQVRALRMKGLGRKRVPDRTAAAHRARQSRNVPRR
jgi:hypothetical protein